MTDTTQQAPADRAEAILDTIVKMKGGTQRPGQVLMARSIAACMAERTPLLIEGGTGIGKALDVDTLIPTPNGFVRMGDLREGDYVYNERGKPAKVIKAFNVMLNRPCYRVDFSDGSHLIADAEHQWDTVPASMRGAPSATGDLWENAVTVTTEEIADSLIRNKRLNHHIPLAAPLQTKPGRTPLPMDPYTLGVWLFATPTPRRGQYAVRAHALAGQDIPGLTRHPDLPAVFIPDEKTEAALDALGVLNGDRVIPERYIFHTEATRRAVLAGAADSAGASMVPPRSRGQVRISHHNTNLLASLRTLLATLNIRTSQRDGSDGTDAMRRPAYLTYTPEVSPFRGAHDKAAKLALDDAGPLDYRAKRRSIVSVTPVKSRPVRCITVDSERHLYLAGETLIPTHNSIGYLAGALASGRTTVVAPHTKALQDQLVGDLELIADSYNPDVKGNGLQHKPTYTVIKGRSTYLCLRKMKSPSGEPEQEELVDPETGTTVNGNTGEVSEPSSELGQELKTIYEWEETTTSGDRADLPFPVSGKAWAQVSSTADECIGASKCPFAEQCYSERVRREAKQADIIVVNQAYLAVAMKIGDLLPETVAGVVVDEAHEFASVVAGTFGAQVSRARVDNLVKTCKPLADNTRAEKVMSDITKINERFMELRDPKDADRDLPTEDAPRELFTELNNNFAALSTYAERLPASTENEQATKESTQRAIANIRSDIDLLLVGNTDDQVVWADVDERKGLTFHAAKFDPAEEIFERLLSVYKSVVFTSATLSIAGKFDITARRHGFGTDNSPFRWQIVPSPFDYPKQGRIFYPPDMPDPANRTPEGGEAYLTAVGEVAARVATAANGRTLVLCTSRKSVNTVGAYLSEHLDQDKNPVIIQEPGGSAKHLAAAFAADPHSVLVGTRTFWTGVSTEGDTCAAVVMDKLPFPSPGDPLIAARSEKEDRVKKWNGFRNVSLAEAILTIVQGAGRLIRTVNDRGAVIVCDPRIHPTGKLRKSYARDVARALPDFAPVNTWDDLEAYLADIDATANDDTAPVVIETDETDDAA